VDAVNIRDTSDGNESSFIAEDDGVRLGYICATRGVIRELEVAQDRRREGIATALLDALVSCLEPGTWLEVVATREGESFYVARGFESTRHFRMQVKP
jgi:GNAT superfamily N-acetyltransferase